MKTAERFESGPGIPLAVSSPPSPGLACLDSQERFGPYFAKVGVRLAFRGIIASRGGFVGVPESRPFRFTTLLSVFERDSSSETSNHLSILPPGIGPATDESAALSFLKDMIEVGDRPLDSILRTIADAAGRLTGASGVALAMWKDGAMVCRARGGDAAPPLGSELTAGAGISGECLSTGEIQHCADTEGDALVDTDVCRSFGLRSIVALPIRGWRGVNGILEVFSTEPEAFGEQHLLILEELAALAERARALQPQDASPPEKQAAG